MVTEMYTTKGRKPLHLVWLVERHSMFIRVQDERRFLKQKCSGGKCGQFIYRIGPMPIYVHQMKDILAKGLTHWPLGELNDSLEK